MARPRESTARRRRGGRALGPVQGVQPGGPRAPSPGQPGGGEPRAGLDPKLGFPQGGLPECEGGGYAGLPGKRGRWAPSLPGRGSRGAAKSPAALGGAGGALGARRGDARLPLVRKAEPGTRGGGGRSCRRLRDAVAVPLPAAAAPRRVPGSGPGYGSGRGAARLEWLLRVTGRAGPGGRKERACASSAEGRRRARGPLLGEGEGGTTRAEPSCAGATRGARRAWEELGAGAGPDAPAGLTRGRWLRPDCVTGRG